MNWKRYLVIITAALFIFLMGVGAFIYESSNSAALADSSENNNTINKSEQQSNEQRYSDLTAKQCKRSH